MSNETRYRGRKIVFWGTTKTFNVINGQGLCVYQGASMADSQAWIDDKIERFGGQLPSASYPKNGWDYPDGWSEE
jgi:hypothetical protein